LKLSNQSRVEKIAVFAKSPNIEILSLLREEFSDFSLILVTPERICHNGFEVIHDDEILNRENIIVKLENCGPLVGWYYQQLLKYKTVITLGGECTMIIDGDTVCRRKLATPDTLFRTTRQLNSSYYNFNAKILPNFRTRDRSNFISNQMVFNPELLYKMLKDIEFNSETDWISAIVQNLDSAGFYRFSEYQLYATFALHHSVAKVHDVRVFRRMDLVGLPLSHGLENYDVVAWETFHSRDLIKAYMARLYYRLGWCIA
jgi:hypothetical protein